MTDSDLTRAWFPAAKLQGVILNGVRAQGVNFTEASLADVQAQKADFREADLGSAWLAGADMSQSQFNGADLNATRARRTDFSESDLTGANLEDADLRELRARGTKLANSNLRGSDLRQADLSGADLTQADLSLATLVETTLDGATLSHARVFGASTWEVKLADAIQDRLVITRDGEPTITVSDLEVAQFIYLMLDNKKLRNVIDTVTSKTVLILGRFSAERKAVLDAIREHLRTLDFVSIIFDFEPSPARNLTETVTLLARMARFVIADLTEPKSIPQELHAIVRDVRVPVLPIILQGKDGYTMFDDLLEEDNVLRVHEYVDMASVLESLSTEWLPEVDEALQQIAAKRADAVSKRPKRD